MGSERATAADIAERTRARRRAALPPDVVRRIDRARTTSRIAEGLGLALMVGGVAVILLASSPALVAAGLLPVALGFLLTLAGERRLSRLAAIEARDWGSEGMVGHGADPIALGWGLAGGAAISSGAASCGDGGDAGGTDNC